MFISVLEDSKYNKIFEWRVFWMKMGNRPYQYCFKTLYFGKNSVNVLLFFIVGNQGRNKVSNFKRQSQTEINGFPLRGINW